MNFIKWLLKIWHVITYKFRKEKVYINQARLSGAGSFIDIRYRLSRPDKAQGRFPVHLIEEETGQRFELMRLTKFGPIQTKHNKYQHTGVLLFRNHDNIVRPNSMVTLVFGKLHTEHIRII
ncbi:MAG: hypothetical protein ACM3KR_03165 [Deltaproteobacteria bacterium]